MYGFRVNNNTSGGPHTFAQNSRPDRSRSFIAVDQGLAVLGFPNNIKDPTGVGPWQFNVKDLLAFVNKSKQLVRPQSPQFRRAAADIECSAGPFRIKLRIEDAYVTSCFVLYDQMCLFSVGNEMAFTTLFCGSSARMSGTGGNAMIP